MTRMKLRLFPTDSCLLKLVSFVIAVMVWHHLRYFQEFGFGKKSIGTIIEEEAASVVLEDFVEKFGREGGLETSFRD